MKLLVCTDRFKDKKLIEFFSRWANIIFKFAHTDLPTTTMSKFKLTQVLNYLDHHFHVALWLFFLYGWWFCFPVCDSFAILIWCVSWTCAVSLQFLFLVLWWGAIFPQSTSFPLSPLGGIGHKHAKCWEENAHLQSEGWVFKEQQCVKCTVPYNYWKCEEFWVNIISGTKWCSQGGRF